MKNASSLSLALCFALVACSPSCNSEDGGGQSAQAGATSTGGTRGGVTGVSGGSGGGSVASATGGLDSASKGGGSQGGGGNGNSGGSTARTSTAGSGGASAKGGESTSGGGMAGAGGTSAKYGGTSAATAGTSGRSGGTALTSSGPGGAGGTSLAKGGTTSSGGTSNGGTSGGGSTAGTSATGVPVTITPGTVWNDTQGKVIQAHGHGITKVGDTYYWLGEDKTNGSPFQNINCYSSTDLKNWTFVKSVLTRQASGDLGPNRIIERPHVIHNASTNQFVMYMHVDNSSYTDRKAGVATCSTVCGDYTYRGSSKPLGRDSLDDTLFQDGTTGYFISEDRTSVKLQIYKLSDDYLTIASLVTSLPQIESPAVIKIDGTYFIFGSHLTGWSTNDNQYITATSMAGPWSALKSFAPAGTNTCNSQVTFILPITGSSGTVCMFMGDRWNPNNLTDSRYIWQPLTLKGTSVSMTCPTSWTLDAAAGTWK